MVNINFPFSSLIKYLHFDLLLIKFSLSLSLSLSLSSPVAPINDCAHPVSMQFVCSTKDGILELFEVLQYLPNIVTNVTQRGQDQYILDLQMSRSILQKLWSQVFSFGLASKLNSLFTIELLGSFVLRMNHKQGIETTKGNDN